MIDSNILQHYLDLREQRLMEQIMSKLTPKIDEAVRSFEAKAAEIMEFVRSIRAEQQELRGRAATDEDLAKLDELDARIDAFDPTTPATLDEDDDLVDGDGDDTDGEATEDQPPAA